jgi:serine/threonine-protein kinase
METKKFVDQLRDCGLLSDRRLEKAVKELTPSMRDGKLLARELIQRGVLTAYQANHVLTGRGKELMLGQYRIVERLGQSITGQTYKAVHATMGRLVLIRVMAPHLSNNPQERARFTREVQNIAQLSHTNILTAFDAFEVGGMYVLVMEYVEGMDMTALVHHAGPLPVQLACNFLRQTALGLQHAFERGLGWCNIRPENILIAGYQSQGKNSDSSTSSAVPRGVVKILNLGLADLSQGSAMFASGKSGVISKSTPNVGAPDFCAPEIALNARAADIRSDVYALGCILYFALVGKPPFPEGNPNDKIFAHQFKEPAPLEKVRTDVPPKLGAVVKRMMAKNPVDRYQTPAELANELTPFCVSGSPAAKRP